MNVFPVTTNIEFNSQWQEDWSFVAVKKTGSGRRKTLCNRAFPDWRISVKFTGLDDSQVEKIAGFIGQQKGPFAEFLWLDPTYYKETMVQIGTGNGTDKAFQLLRNFDNRYVIPVTDYVPGSLIAYVDGSPVTVSSVADGMVTLDSAPASGKVVAATYEYYWRVAFDDDKFSWQDQFINLYKFSQINLVTTWGG